MSSSRNPGRTSPRTPQASGFASGDGGASRKPAQENDEGRPKAPLEHPEPSTVETPDPSRIESPTDDQLEHPRPSTVDTPDPDRPGRGRGQ